MNRSRLYWKSAAFGRKAKFEPLSSALPEAFASSSIPYPLDIVLPLRLAYSTKLRVHRAYRVPRV